MAVTKLNDSNFDVFVRQNKIVVVDFNAVWCPPCRRMTPIFHEMSEEYPHLQFVSVDVDESPKTASQFDVMSIPLFVLIIDGQTRASVLGADVSRLSTLLKSVNV